MIKTLLKHVKQYKAASIATPFFMILEVAMEMTVPYLMASLVDDGIEKSDMRHILIVGGIMFIAALVGLFAGLMFSRQVYPRGEKPPQPSAFGRFDGCWR